MLHLNKLKEKKFYLVKYTMKSLIYTQLHTLKYLALLYGLKNYTILILGHAECLKFNKYFLQYKYMTLDRRLILDISLMLGKSFATP